MNLFFKSLYNSIALLFRKTSDIVVKEPERIGEKYPKPDFVVVKGTKYKTHGKYRTKTRNAKGLVVHYTVSGGSSNSAVSILKYLARKGYGAMVLDEDGTIYVPENFNFQTDVAWHAGKSAYKDLNGMSRYLMGMEICNWGRLTKSSKKRVTKMRASEGVANVVAGEYEPYTAAQEEALIDFCLWQKQVNPEFDFDFVVGHDEVCVPKGRKTDPGASLSMTMPKFRLLLRSKS